jgi:small-conductance mechanosensitive channel
VSAVARTWPLRELLESAAILAGSYVAARLLSFVLGHLLARAAKRTATTLDHRLIHALQRPVTYALFLIGAYVAVHRLPIQDGWTRGLDDAIFTIAVALVGLGAVRAYGILLAWYSTETRLSAETGITREFGPLLNKLGTIFVVVVATIAILQHFSVNVESLVVSLGVGSLAVGLAAQDTLANMFAGFTLMLDRPFRLGDRIQLSTGEVGDVEAIGMRATRLKTTDDTVLIIPNSVLVKDRVVNQSRPSRHLTTRLEVGVAFGTDLATVKRVLVEAALACERVDRDRQPVALVTRFGDLVIQCRLVFWARDYTEQGLALSDVHEEVYRRFREAGIEMPLLVRRIVQEVARPA